MKKRYVKIKDLHKIEIIAVAGSGKCYCYENSKEKEYWNGVNGLESCKNICCRDKRKSEWSFELINQGATRKGVCGVDSNSIYQNQMCTTNNLRILGSQTSISSKSTSTSV
ncbi:MAG: hypothetical protein WCH10_03750 [bacterium]